MDDVARTVWDDRISLTADELLNPTGRRSGRIDEASRMNAEMIKSGPGAETEVPVACDEGGIGDGTYRRARRALDVRLTRVGF